MLTRSQVWNGAIEDPVAIQKEFGFDDVYDTSSTDEDEDTPGPLLSFSLARLS